MKERECQGRGDGERGDWRRESVGGRGDGEEGGEEEGGAFKERGRGRVMKRGICGEGLREGHGGCLIPTGEFRKRMREEKDMLGLVVRNISRKPLEICCRS